MKIINSDPTLAKYRPIPRVPETARVSESQQSECCCPELCQLDHDN
jgi:hypothetical protein